MMRQETEKKNQPTVSAEMRRRGGKGGGYCKGRGSGRRGVLTKAKRKPTTIKWGMTIEM